tara:strand:+ start:161 stop:898 length:738 start_codon:yes stop_codon:yes gene_type:complete
MISVSAKLDSGKLKTFRRKFGESSNQALVRLGVSVAKESAQLTKPMGRSKKKVIAGIVAGAKSNIADLPARKFNQVAKKKNPAFNFRAGWVRLGNDQILRSSDDVYKFIEKHRTNKGRVKKLSSRDKAICKTADMNKTLRARRKLAGVAKGSWLGAGKSLAKKSKGPDPARVGKNFMSWAQKHSGLGRATLRKRILGKSEAHLISEAVATKDKGIFSRNDAREALKRSWKKTLAWYRRETKRRLA